jgi:hypothetical protein
VVPRAIPETTPEKSAIVATLVLLLFHVPPLVPSLIIVVPPTQMLVGPEMGTGSELIVTFCVV